MILLDEHKMLKAAVKIGRNVQMMRKDGGRKQENSKHKIRLRLLKFNETEQ